MNDEWTETTLAVVAEVNPREAPLPADAPFVTMADVSEWGWWAQPSGERGNRGGARARAGDTLMARITPCLENGKIAMVPYESEVVGGSTEFLVLRAGPRLIPEFLFRWATCASTHRAAIDLMVGTSGRKRVSGSDISALPITVPPLSVQRRIVDLVGHLDTHLANLEWELVARAELHDALAENLIEDYPRMTVGELAHSDQGLVGGPFGSDLTRKDYTARGVPVIRGTNMPSQGMFIGGDFAFVAQDKADSLGRNLAIPGDVIFTQRGTLGQVGMVPARPARYVVSQSQMRLRVDPDLALGEFVYFHFARPSVVAAMKALNSATANPHINLGILGRQEVPVPDLRRQAEICQTLRFSMTGLAALSAECNALKDLRSALLESLLSGAIQIPESYDALLGVG